MRISDWSSDVCSSDLHCEGALREGVLYDLLGRHHHEDVRERTLGSLMERYHVDQEQAARVERKALHAFDKVADDWDLNDGVWREMLGGAAKVHEVGRAEERRVGQGGVGMCRSRGAL